MKTVYLFPALLSLVLSSCSDQPHSTIETRDTVARTIERIDPALDELLDSSEEMKVLADGFKWAEGPLWDEANEQLLFSDVPENVVYAWKEGAGVSRFLEPSGFTGEHFEGSEPGSNGLAFDLEGRLVLCQHGDRRVAILNEDGQGFTTVADRWDGKRFNSPNDLCFDSLGNLYLTDPPFGAESPEARELEENGVYRVSVAGEVTLLSNELARPNGIALSPDERTLYVANSQRNRPVILAFPLSEDGSVGDPKVFFDGTPLFQPGRRGVPDGLKVDERGNVWATGPGGVHVIDEEGELLGSLLTGKPTSNCAFGGLDGKTLFITADDVLLRIQTKVRGSRPR